MVFELVVILVFNYFYVLLFFFYCPYKFSNKIIDLLHLKVYGVFDQINRSFSSLIRRTSAKCLVLVCLMHSCCLPLTFEWCARTNGTSRLCFGYIYIYPCFIYTFGLIQCIARLIDTDTRLVGFRKHIACVVSTQMPTVHKRQPDRSV